MVCQHAPAINHQHVKRTMQEGIGGRAQKGSKARSSARRAMAPTLGCATPRLSKSSGCLMGSSITCAHAQAVSSASFHQNKWHRSPAV